MRLLFPFCVFYFSISCIYAQYTNTSYADAQEIKKRILLVILPEEDRHFLGQLAEENPDIAYKYKDDIAGQREALRKVVSREWKFSDSIIFVTHKESKDLIKSAPDKYALMKMTEQIQDKVYMQSAYKSILQTTGWEKVNGRYVYNIRNRYSNSMMGITSLTIDLPKNVVSVYLPKVSPSEGDFTFALHQIEYILSTILKNEKNNAKKIFKEARLSANELKNKTLFLDETTLKEADFSKAYPYPIKIVNYETIENALIDKDSNIVLITNSRYDAANSILTLSNAGTGKIYSHFTETTFEYGDIDGTQYSIQVLYPFITVRKMELFGLEQK